jgi:hypothetical protein
VKIERKPNKQERCGYALMMTITFVSIAALLLAGMMRWTSGTALQTERNNLFRASTGAADAATELAMGYMWRDFYNQALGPASSYNAYLPDQTGWPVQFYFSNGARVANHTGVITEPSNWTTNWQSLNTFGTRYSGLSAYVEQCTVASTATTANQPYEVSATVQQKFDLAAIPIFQFAVFYNLNMEIDPGANMTLTGPVFSNDGIWARGLGTFNSSVSAVGVVNTNGTDPYVSGKIDSNESVFDQGVTSNANSLTLPIGATNSPTAVRSLLGLPPTNVAPYSASGLNYFADEADLVISNSSGGKLSVFFQDPNASTALTAVPNDLTNVTSTGSGASTVYTTNYAYSFATNVSFYDFRETKTVHAVQVDVGALNTWLNNAHGGLAYNNQMNLHSGHHINSVYVYNNNPVTSSSLPAVRVSDGAVLPTDGLTVVTPDPLYVLGNYNASGSSLNNGTNVLNTAPAALIGDAITVLSTNWSDSSYTSGTSTASRPPASTTINAAAFEGIVPSNGANYSGGVENFLRLLENWNSNITLTYNGSIVVMFPSQYATNKWSGSYYGVPHRSWAFDLNFLSQKGLPPLTPEVYAILRQNWAVYGKEVPGS